MGEVDIRITYNQEKNEIFRGITYFNKDGKKWCSFPNVKRDDKWLPYYERTPALSKDILDQTVHLIEGYLVEKEMGL